ncbi:MAG: polymer-forming cytoskeletal protein, partial [Aquificaceae bacterium]
EDVIVYGKIEGDIRAKSVELKSGSKVDGNIRTTELVIERGAMYNGECRMGQSSSVDMSPIGSPSS